METKSRYEVIADLEKQKRILICEKAEIDDEVKIKERIVKNLKRGKEDLAKKDEDFKMEQANAISDLDRKRTNWEFKMKNTKEQVDREVEDAKEDVINYKKSVDAKKKTFDELIKGINESLERFGKLQSK